MIKTIIFDLGRVIVPFDFKRAYDRISPLCGFSAEQIPERLRTTDLVNRFECGLVEPDVFVKELGKALEFSPSYDEFCDIWSSIFARETLIPDAMIADLHERHRVLLLSNTNHIHFEMIKANYPILRHFDHLVLSYKVGALKPSPKIYHEAIANAQCRPEECFFTDDISDYVAGARREGIDAVQFESATQIAKELEKRGVAVMLPA